MSDVANLLRRNLNTVLNQRDSAKRRVALKDLWTQDGVLWTSDGTHIGRAAIGRAVAGMHLQYPEFSFSLEEQVDEIPDVGRVRWFFGAAGSPPALHGVDIVVVRNGRITTMYRFLDGPNL